MEISLGFKTLDDDDIAAISSCDVLRFVVCSNAGSSAPQNSINICECVWGMHSHSPCAPNAINICDRGNTPHTHIWAPIHILVGHSKHTQPQTHTWPTPHTDADDNKHTRLRHLAVNRANYLSTLFIFIIDIDVYHYLIGRTPNDYTRYASKLLCVVKLNHLYSQ